MFSCRSSAISMRLQITFSKTGALRYIGHLDLHTLWERAARRAGLPLAYSRGFHPQPKINLASALPLGFSSRCEVVDMRLDQEVDLAALPARLQAAMPSGIGILGVEAIDEDAPALQTRLSAAEYEVTLAESADAPGLKRRIEELLANTSLPRQRRSKTYDLRPLIEDLHLSAGDKIFMRLSAREGATGRPDEVLEALYIPPEKAHIERTCLIFR
jgi:radical SAM-linked protein